MKRQIHQTVREERALDGGRRIGLTFHAEGEAIPGILLLPAATTAPAPAVLLLHGFGGRKEYMADVAGRALLRRGVASLAIDLPLHGERGSADERQWGGNPLKLAAEWRLGVAESTLALRFLAARPEIDGTRLAILGFSMGAYLGLMVAAADPAVRALVLAAGGDLPAGAPFERMIRAVVDPRKAARGLAGRPLLMLHGKWDRTIRPEQAERLFEAAGEPKEIRWYDCGHRLPDDAVGAAAEWVAERLSTTSS